MAACPKARAACRCAGAPPHGVGNPVLTTIPDYAAHGHKRNRRGLPIPGRIPRPTRQRAPLPPPPPSSAPRLPRQECLSCYRQRFQDLLVQPAAARAAKAQTPEAKVVGVAKALWTKLAKAPAHKQPPPHQQVGVPWPSALLRLLKLLKHPVLTA